MSSMPSNGEAAVAALIERLHAWPRSGSEHQARMSARLQPYDHLFSPIAVNQLTICNRIVMGPMGNLGMADADGRPTAKMIAYFAERAKGGAG